MNRPFAVLSMVLLVSVILNVGLIFERVTGKSLICSAVDEAAIVPVELAEERGTLDSAIAIAIVELSALKDMAVRENALGTVKVIEKLLAQKRSKLEGAGIKLLDSTNNGG